MPAHGGMVPDAPSGEEGLMSADDVAAMGDRQEDWNRVNMLLDTVLLSGSPTVTHADGAEAERVDATDSGCVVRTENVVHAYGHLLVDCAASECVEWERCTSNDVWEVLNTLGVEACVHVFYDQLKQVVSFDGTYIDDHHLMVVSDTVCRGGTLMPLNRHGINRSDSSPLMRCSFEETMDVVCYAAMFAEHENGRGVSTSIMSGQLANFGSGGVEVLFPTKDFHKCDAEMQSDVRVLRSTCRSHTGKADEEVMEYVIDGAKMGGANPRPLSPIDDTSSRKRARFRPVSPSW